MERPMSPVRLKLHAALARLGGSACTRVSISLLVAMLIIAIVGWTRTQPRDPFASLPQPWLGQGCHCRTFVSVAH